MVKDDKIYASINFGTKTMDEAWQDEFIAEQMRKADIEYLKEKYNEQLLLLKDIGRLSKEAILYQRFIAGHPVKESDDFESYRHSEVILSTRQNELELVKAEIDMQLVKMELQPIRIQHLFLGDEEDEVDEPEKTVN